MLRLENIYKSFPHHFEPILKGINLEIQEGEFCVILGSNGSGKSSLLKTITGEYALDSGKIFLASQEISSWPLYKRAKMISSVAQDITKGTVQEMTLLENMVLSSLRGKSGVLRFYHNKKDEMESLIQELGLGLEKYIMQPLHILSGGQRQSIATLMATLSDPLLLVLDEHTSALDPKTQSHLMEYTAQKVKNKKLTTLMVTHHLKDALRYGDRLIIMNRGEIVLDVKEGKENLCIDDLLQKYGALE